MSVGIQASERESLSFVLTKVMCGPSVTHCAEHALFVLRRTELEHKYCHWKHLLASITGSLFAWHIGLLFLVPVLGCQ